MIFEASVNGIYVRVSVNADGTATISEMVPNEDLYWNNERAMVRVG
jgi:hypothetical protein